jgi:hypothetical protein
MRLQFRFHYHMSHIDDVLDSVGGARFFSSRDLTSGFWQLRLMETDVPKTTFRTPTGLYQWRILPTRLRQLPCTVPTHYVRSLPEGNSRSHDGTEVITLGNFIQVYMDDLLVYSKTAEGHLAHLEFTFQSYVRAWILSQPEEM